MQTHPLAFIGSLIVALVLGVSACGARSDLASRGATGEHASSQVFEGEANIDFLSATSDGGLIAAMQLEHSIDFCGDVLVSAGKKDVVVAKLSP
jgi:hypothetical protein